MAILIPKDSDHHQSARWKPNVDIYRTSEGWVVKLDLAGVRPEDVTISASDKSVSVSGVRRDWLIRKGWSYYSMEINYSHFERKVQFPCDLGEVQTSSEWRHGMLLIYLKCQVSWP